MLKQWKWRSYHLIFGYPFIYNYNLKDVGGQEKYRSMWRHYYTGTQVFENECYLNIGSDIYDWCCRSRSFWSSQKRNGKDGKWWSIESIKIEDILCRIQNG